MGFMSLRYLETAADVVAQLGGIKAVAALTGRKYSAAANWPAFGRFPPNTYLALTKALEQHQCMAPPTLWGMATAEQAQAAE